MSVKESVSALSLCARQGFLPSSMELVSLVTFGLVVLPVNLIFIRYDLTT